MSLFAGLKEKITDYAGVYIKLLKLGFIEKTAGLLSYFMFVMICLFIIICIIMFTGFGLTEVFISLGLTRVASFFITTGIYLVSLILIIMLRKKIIRFFTNEMIVVMTENDDKKDDED
jgi:hypothetical protein